MIRSGSNSRVVPSPVQTGHAPCGELNEKLRGSISVSPTTPCTGQENFSEKTIASPSTICASAMPLAIFNAVSSDSMMRTRSGWSSGVTPSS